MPYYGVASGRNIGVYDNWEDCKDQVHRYSRNDYKKFNTAHEAWDFVDQRSTIASEANNYIKQSCSSNVPSQNAIACRDNYQVAKRDFGESKTYQRTDYQEGKNGCVVRERTYTSGRQGPNGYYVEKRERTYWERR